MQVKSLFVYPIKSAQAVGVSTLQFDALGALYDRRWMIVRPNGMFLTQREYPALAKIIAVPVATGLMMTVPGQRPIVVGEPDLGKVLSCKIWLDEVQCLECSVEAAELLSQYLQTEVRLVYADTKQYERKMHPVAGRVNDALSLVDSAPLMLVSDSTTDLLAKHLGQPVSISRFRPNIVIADARPHVEDQWQRIQIGAAEVIITKPCTRCAIPAIDPESLEITPGFHSALAEYRRIDGQIVFGQNALVTNQQAVIQVGDSVKVLAP